MTTPFPQTLAGRVAVVTGASRGIGVGIARELARRGANVVINYVRSAAAAEDVAKALQADFGVQAIAVQANVTVQADIVRLFQEAVARFGHVDAVISNSGMEAFDRAVDVTPERFREVFDLNAAAQFFVAVEAYKTMKAHPPQGGHGRIVFLSSISVRMMNVPNHALYAGSKAAVEGIMRGLATDFARDGITVNTIAPGGIKSTDMFVDAAPHFIRAAGVTDSTDGWTAEQVEAAQAKTVPLGRCGEPRDIGRIAAWLASEDSGWITGEIITATGGAMG